METHYLLLSLVTATLGFLIWYALSPSLRLPKSFQVQYDVNHSYFHRILRRRMAAFLIYTIAPIIFISMSGQFEGMTLIDLGISFEWNPKVTFWVLLTVPLSILYNWFNANKKYNLIDYPEIRVTIWPPFNLFLSAAGWAVYLFGMEFLYRGLVLQSVYMNTGGGNIWPAIFISTGIYAMIHYFKDNRISVFCIPYGLIACYITLDSGSLLPAYLLHFSAALINEWATIYYHPEMNFSKQLY